MNQKKVKILPLSILIISVLCFLSVGYWIYQKSVRNVIYATTLSFMKQIADHDRQNMLNQMSSKWLALTTITNRVDAAREYTMDEAFEDLKLNVVSGTFRRLYLVTEQGVVYSHTALKTSLEDMAWKDDYLNSEAPFAGIFRESSREHWGEYVVYGVRLSEPVRCGEESVAGMVGLVPISAISEQMRLESFDQMGVTVVMQSNGEIITSSTVYDSNISNNYLNFLESTQLQEGCTREGIQSGIQNGEQQLFRFSVDGESFYTLIEPLKDDYNSGWNLVVQLSDKVTTDQVQRLLMQSLVFFVLIGIVCLFVVIFIYRKIDEVKTLRIVEQTKTSFLANMSHEIRTPLNGISGLCYLMQENMDDKEKLTEYLQKTVASTAFLKDIINDVLDMSKIESGQLELICRNIDLNGLLSEVETLLETQARHKQIDFTVNTQGIKQKWIAGDPIRIKQILMNILGNAIKFTPEGGKVSLNAIQTLKNGTAVTTFVIADNGCGMSPEFLTRIWLPFEQEKIYKNGTGLGTTISKTLVEKMQGSISVESKPEQGTAFTITIPFPISKERDILRERGGRETAVSIRDKHILVAVDIFEAGEAGFFDLILMDIQMPEMDGYEAARRIRQSSHPDAKTITIIAVTANAFQEDLDRALAAGMNDAVTKPLDVAALIDKISRIEKGEQI